MRLSSSPPEPAILEHQAGDVSEAAAAQPVPVEPEPEQSAIARETAGAVRLSPMEELLGSMWSQVLGKEQIDPDDNFFLCGGDSLLATQLMLYVRARLKIDLPFRVLVEEAPTLRTFAVKVEEALRRRNRPLPSSHGSCPA